jgi:CelD/BcsL family acetyltransferase involved in cellulose biosynthesis
VRQPTASQMTATDSRINTSITEHRSALQETSLSWDALAVASSRPYCAPGWMLSWWDHVRPAGSTLRALAVREGTELIGLLPLCLSRDKRGIVTGHLLGHDTSSYSEPLAFEGRQRQVAAAIASSLSAPGIGPDVLSLTGIPHKSPWPRLLQETWPGPRPRLSLVSTMQAPFTDLPSSGFEAWFGGRSRNFRQQARSRRREFLRRGGRFHRAESLSEMVGGLRDLERLHLGRWAARGGSQALVPGVMPMLTQASGELGPDRMQVWTAEIDEGAVAAALFLSAGQEMHFWLGGFDEAWASLSLSVLLLVEAVRHAAGAGYSRVSFGPGAQDYKYRLATGEEQLDWIDLLPVNRRYPYVRLVQSPRRLYQLTARRTPPHVKERVKSAAKYLFDRPHAAIKNNKETGNS